MVSKPTCPQCGAEVPTALMMGLCPKCVGKVVFQIDPAAPPANQPGERIRYFGDYELLEEIARGGMGVVWRARQVSLNRPVALKMILAGQLATQTEMDRFRREAQAAAKLDHPNIVAIYEVGEHQGQQYFAMQLVEGQSLAQRLPGSSRREEAQTSRLSTLNSQPSTAKLEPPHVGCYDPGDAANLLAKVARAVHHAHQRGILHRDLKPGNILLDAQGEPHVTDFGLAKQVDSALDLTRSEAVLGTPHYMSPEQAQGRKDLTTATDIYSLGAVLYYLLTGRPAFQADTPLGVLKKVIEEEPVPPSEALGPVGRVGPVRRKTTSPIDQDLETICLKCLEKDPERRYHSAEALADDLDRWLRQEPILARPTTTFQRLAKWVRRKPLVASLVAAMLVSVVAGTGALTLALRRAVRAEHNVTEKLRDAYLAQAHANRLTTEPGRRFHSLEILAKAAAIRNGSDLRDEAIACLALTDVRSVRQVLVPGSDGTTAVSNGEWDRYATSLPDGAVSVRQLSDERELFRLPPVGAKIKHTILFSPSNQWLAVGYTDNRVRLWDLNRRAVTATLPAAGEMNCSGFHPTEPLVAVADGRETVNIVEAATGRIVRTVAVPKWPRLVAYSPDGRALAVSTDSRSSIVVVEVRTGESISMLPHPGMEVASLAWHPDSRRLAATAYDRQVRLWDALSGKLLHPLTGHAEEPHGVAFHPDGTLLVSGGHDGLMVWSVASGQRLLFLAGGRFHPKFSPAGDRFVVLGGSIGGFELCELAHGVPVRTLGRNEAHAAKRTAAFHPDGRWLVFADGTGVRGFEFRTGRELGLAAGWGELVRSLSFDSRGQLWAAGDKGLLCGALDDGQEPITWQPTPPRTIDPRALPSACSISADRRLLAVPPGDGNCRVLHTETGTEAARARTGPCSYASFSPDNRWLATGGWHQKEVVIWELLSGQTNLQKRFTLREDKALFGLVAFSPDGRRLAVSWGPFLKLYDAANWQPVWSRAVTDSLSEMAWSPTGDVLALRDANKLIRLLNPETGTAHASLETPNAFAVQDLTFSPDGAHLAAVSATTRELFVWDLAGIRRKLTSLGLDW
ncbi:MAG: protein kinase [Verrucomicrobia bacterium]|nr:protein kinase [Verrucomicrobiota bacterium]